MLFRSPGMMTGQILSGVSPLIAVRYQIMIMTMILGSGGCGAALMLWQLGRAGQSGVQADNGLTNHKLADNDK